MNNSNRIVANTLIVYGQLIVTTILNLLVTRYVLLALGEQDYGIYMLVAGVVTMLNIFTTSLSHASMRFMGHEMGKGDTEKTISVFNTSVRIHFALGIALILLLEIGGWIMFAYFMNIPDDKIVTAKIVYQFMIVTTFVSCISVPFDAVINAHENLLFLSAVTILDVVLKLILSIWLMKADVNRLLIYGLGMMLVQILLRFIKQFYSTKKYEECSLKLKIQRNTSLMKSMLSFTGWEMFRTIAAMCQGQLRAILINNFFGVNLNAGEGIGKKVNTQVNMVSTGITKAITPQMNKSEGGGNREKMIKLTLVGVKYTTFMFALVSMPLLLETPYVLEVWLSNVPTYTVIFCQLSLIMQLADKFTWQIGNALRAVGRIKEYQVVSGILAIFGVFVAYFIFKAGGSPESIYYVELGVILVTGAYRLYFGKKFIDIDPIYFLKSTALPVIVPLIAAFVAAFLVQRTLPVGFARFCAVTLIFMICFSLLFIFTGMKAEERKQMFEIFKSFIKRK